jgi:hypothetical protein
VSQDFLIGLCDRLDARPLKRQNTLIDITASQVLLLENLLIAGQGTIAVEIKVLIS